MEASIKRISTIFCADVDECAGTHGCQQVCINTDGGFRCDCDSGFELNSDNNTCSGSNYRTINTSIFV